MSFIPKLSPDGKSWLPNDWDPEGIARHAAIKQQASATVQVHQASSPQAPAPVKARASVKAPTKSSK